MLARRHNSDRSSMRSLIIILLLLLANAALAGAKTVHPETAPGCSVAGLANVNPPGAENVAQYITRRFL